HHAVHAESVGDESRNVLRPNRPLAEDALAETSRAHERRVAGLGRGDDLEQVQIARRIEEMHPEESLAERPAPSFHELPHWNARRVRGDDRPLRYHRLETRVEVAFWLELLDDRLDDQVAIAQKLQVVAHVADAY